MADDVETIVGGAEGGCGGMWSVGVSGTQLVSSFARSCTDLVVCSFMAAGPDACETSDVVTWLRVVGRAALYEARRLVFIIFNCSLAFFLVCSDCTGQSLR